MTARDRFPGDASRFAVTIARDLLLVEEAQRLPYRVFVEELGARLASRDRGLDEDAFDELCEHLVVRDVVSGEAVGTYRILTPEAAREAGGYYTEQEFDLAGLAPLRGRMAEVGRTCVDPACRSGAVMLLMWSALARYAIDKGFEHIIGCASIGLGAWVCGAPARDPEFGCADLPMLLALDRLDARFARHVLRLAA